MKCSSFCHPSSALEVNGCRKRMGSQRGVCWRDVLPKLVFILPMKGLPKSSCFKETNPSPNYFTQAVSDFLMLFGNTIVVANKIFGPFVDHSGSESTVKCLTQASLNIQVQPRGGVLVPLLAHAFSLSIQKTHTPKTAGVLVVCL